MQLDRRIQLLDWFLKRRKPIPQMTLDEIQQMNQKPIPPLLAWLFLGSKVPLFQVTEAEIPGRHGAIPIRRYIPSGDRPLPLIVFFHGGGWVTGSLESHDEMCRRIAHDTGALVVAVEYRLAPWHPYPVPLEDCYDATVWLANHAESFGAAAHKLIVMGDSAGGNLATAVCLMARDRGYPSIRRQILIYPAVDGTLSGASHDRYANAPMLTKSSVHFYRQQYTRTEDDIYEPYFSPLLAPDLRHLPPALILTAEYDVLHDEGVAYAQRCQEAGVPVQFTDYPGMIHGFLSFPRFCQGAAAAFNEIATYIKDAVLEEKSL